MPETIDLFNTARTPYIDTDLFGIGYGTPPTPTYKGTLLNLATYLSKKLGTGQTTLVGNANYTMQAADFELATSVTLTLSPTWTLVPANSVAAGQRRRVLDLAGVVVPGSFQIAVAPAGSDKINGLNAVVWIAARFGYIVLESDGVSNWAVCEFGPNLVAGNNLSDLPSPSTARGNLGLGTAAVQPITAFLQPSQNLNDLVNKATARSNLGLGALAVLSTILYSNIDATAIATLSQLLANTASKLITTDVFWNSQVPVTIAWAASVTWDFNTFRNGLYTLSGGNSTISVTNPKAGQQGFVVIRNGSVSRTLTFPTIFNWITATTAIYPTANTANLFEYWVESVSLIRTRLTTNI